MRINNFLWIMSQENFALLIHTGVCISIPGYRLELHRLPPFSRKLMDSVLQGMSRTVCYIDDILVTGGSEDEHLMNLELVLERLKTHGITVRKRKCVFMANSVEFLGHRIDAEGLHPLESKIEAMVKVPQSKNVAELKSNGELLCQISAKPIDNYFPVIHIAEEE